MSIFSRESGKPLTDADREELARFATYLEIEAGRRAGADRGVCDMLVAALYYRPTPSPGEVPR